MTTGERISLLRKNKGYSQEYIAQQIGVSRQAVHKWEKNESKPDTNNLIALAEILDTSVDYIICSSATDESRPKNKISKFMVYIIVAIVSALITFIATIIYIANAPVSFDAGACGGGFATAVYDQYACQLVNDNYFYLTRELSDSEKSETTITPVRSSREVTYEGRAIYMTFDLEYNINNSCFFTVPVRFMGERKWIQKYNWQLIEVPQIPDISK